MAEILDYRIVVRVAAHGSLAGAARELDLAPDVVSKRLTRLEASLGIRLFNRTTRSLSLTEAGQQFSDHIAVALGAIEEAESAATGSLAEARGVLRVTAPTSFGRLHIAPALGRFLTEHPRVDLAVSLSDDFVDLAATGTDVAVRIMLPEDSSLVARRLTTNRRLLCATPDYLARHGTPRRFEDLEAHRLLAASGHSLWRLHGPAGPLLYRPRSRVTSDSSEVIRAAILGGLGIGLRSTWDVCDQLRSGELVQVLPDFEGDPGVGIYALYTSRAHVPRKIRAFVDFVAALIPPRPEWDRDLPAADLPRERVAALR